MAPSGDAQLYRGPGMPSAAGATRDDRRCLRRPDLRQFGWLFIRPDQSDGDSSPVSSTIRGSKPAFLISRSARFFYNENYITCPMRHRIEMEGDRTALEYSWRYNGKWNRIAA